MKVLYIFIIYIVSSNATSRIVYNNDVCSKNTDFCSCVDMWVVCDCQNGRQSIGNLFHNKGYVRIKNCSQLVVPHRSFKSGPLMIIFSDIQNLRFEVGAFKMRKNGHINITISNSNLSEIPSDMVGTSPGRPQDSVHPFTGVRGVVFQVTDSTIGRIASGVFANLTLNQVTINNTVIRHIDTGAINNQVHQSINFINNTFISLDKQAVEFYSSQKNTTLMFNGNKFEGNVTQFLAVRIAGDVYIVNNSFPRLYTSPWQLRAQGDITVKGNTFLYLPRHGMDLIAQNRIILVENDIKHLGPQAFLLIKPEARTILFMDGNLIHKLEPLSLCLNDAFQPKSVVIKHVKFQQRCNCNISKTLSQALDIHNLTLEAIYSNGIHEQWFKNGECMLQPRGITHISIDQFLIKSCLHHNNYVMQILVSMGVVLIVLALCVILSWRRMRRTASTVNSIAAGYHSYTEPCPPSTVPGSWLVVQPETRTYQETEIHVLFDKAQEIDNSDDDKSKDDISNNRIQELKRTPSPSSRQSCPVILSTSIK